MVRMTTWLSSSGDRIRYNQSHDEHGRFSSGDRQAVANLHMDTQRTSPIGATAVPHHQAALRELKAARLGALANSTNPKTPEEVAQHLDRAAGHLHTAATNERAWGAEEDVPVRAETLEGLSEHAASLAQSLRT